MVIVLEELFADLLGSESELKFLISEAYRIGFCNNFRKTYKYVVVKFPDWQTKNKAIELLTKEPALNIEGIPIFPDLSIITIQKRRNLNFLTTTLQQDGIAY